LRNTGFIIIIKLAKETRWRDYCRDGGTMERERLERERLKSEDMKGLFFVVA